MKFVFLARALPALLTSLSMYSSHAQSEEPTQKRDDLTRTILHHDSIFWAAYNVCDVNKMATYFTDDLEFYHDKNGYTSPKSKLEEGMRKGLCGNPNWQLRREEIEGTVKVFPMNNYGALIVGEHLFYINETGRKEYLDGYGKFTHLWLFKDDTWKMTRIISYDHGPPPFVNKRKEVQLEQPDRQRLPGRYNSSRGEIATVTMEKNMLKLSMGDFQISMVPESPTKFFAKDRDVQVEFVIEDGEVSKLWVHEKGKVVDELKRL